MPLMYSILFSNRSFSVIISRYRTTYKSCLRMVTDRPYRSGQRDTSRFPLKKVLPEAPRGALPAGQRSGQRGTQPCLPSEVSSSGKGGRGNDFGSCAIQVDLDSEEVFSAAA